MDNFSTVPIGSLTEVLEPDEFEPYVARAVRAPKGVQDIIFSLRAGAYVRGLMRTHNLSGGTAPHVAFAVLRVATGVIRLNQVAAELAERLSIDQNAAEKLALEIERDLFAPVALELNQYLKEIEKNTHDSDTAAGASGPRNGSRVSGVSQKRPETQGMKNVLDLKDRPKPPPVPPPMPGRK